MNVASRILVRITLWFAFSVLMGACSLFGGNDDPEDADWPRQFESFSFTQPNVVVYPGTCKFVRFEYDSRPPTLAEELDIQLDSGSTKVYVEEPLTGETQRGYGPDKDRGFGRIGWRICAGLEEQVNGRIRVSIKGHEDYTTSLDLVHRNVGDYPIAKPQGIVLPLDEVYPTDARWRDDSDVIEIARHDGLILRIDPQSGVIVGTDRFTGVTIADEDRDAFTFMGDRYLLITDLTYDVYHWVDRVTRMELSSVGRPTFDASIGSGEVAIARGGAHVIGIVGGQSTNLQAGQATPAFMSYFDLNRLEHYDLIHRRPRTVPSRMNPYFVLSPNGEHIASVASFAEASMNLGDPWGDDDNLLNNIFTVRDPENPTRCEFYGLNPNRLLSMPTFSGDSHWLAHWPSLYPAGQTGNYGHAPLTVYDAETCTVRAKTFTPVPPTRHRATVALSRDGSMMAAVSESTIQLYNVPTGVDQELQAIETLQGIFTRDLNDDRAVELVPTTKVSNVPDTGPIRRQYIQFPALFFSPDDRYVVSANSRGARIIDTEQEYHYAETPRVDKDQIDVAGAYVRIATVEEDGQPAGDLIYTVNGTSSSFVYRLSADATYVGIDEQEWLYVSRDGLYTRRHLRDQRVEELGTDMPSWTPPSRALVTVNVTETTVELKP